MSTIEQNILKNGNIGNKGRHHGSKNKAQLELQRIGEENAKQILQMHIAEALSGKIEAQQFIINKFLPNAKGGKVIEIDLPEISNAENIKSAFGLIVQNVSDGTISPEEGEKMCNMVEYQRKAIETQELDKRLRIVEDNLLKKER